MIAQRAKRHSDLDRYVAGKKVSVMVALLGHPQYEGHGRVNLFYVDGVKVASQNISDDDYPSEAVMATIALSVAATVGTDGIPSGVTIDTETRDRRNQYRDQVRRNLERSTS